MNFFCAVVHNFFIVKFFSCVPANDGIVAKNYAIAFDYFTYRI